MIGDVLHFTTVFPSFTRLELAGRSGVKITFYDFTVKSLMRRNTWFSISGLYVAWDLLFGASWHCSWHSWKVNRLLNLPSNADIYLSRDSLT